MNSIDIESTEIKLANKIIVQRVLSGSKKVSIYLLINRKRYGLTYVGSHSHIFIDFRNAMGIVTNLVESYNLSLIIDLQLNN